MSNRAVIRHHTAFAWVAGANAEMRGDVRRGHDFRSMRRWRELSLRVRARDLYRCHWCGGEATEADHVWPVSQGGPLWDESLIVACCGPCNRARPLVRHERCGPCAAARAGHARFFNGGSAKTRRLVCLSPRLSGDYSRNAALSPADGTGAAKTRGASRNLSYGHGGRSASRARPAR